MFDFDLDLNINIDDDSDAFQESYNAGSSGYNDFLQGKFNSFDPDAIISGGNNRLKSGMFDMEIEDSDLALGYKNNGPAMTPKPGRFM